MKKLLIIFGLFFTAVLSKSAVKLTGGHICHREENYIETINSSSKFPSDLNSEGKEVLHFENVTKTRTVQFCCPNYEEVELGDKRVCMPICNGKCVNGNCTNDGNCDCNDGFLGEACDEQCPQNFYGSRCSKSCKCGILNCHPITGACLKPGEKILLLSMKSMDDEMMTMKNSSKPKVDHNPYMLMNYSGEYGKEFNHYVKMGVNESDVEESVKKIIEYEVKKAEEEFGQFDGYIILDVENNFEPIHHPQFVTDHHAAIQQHDETVAMVTVGCVILGMLIFLLAIVYIKRATKRVPSSRDIDPETGMNKKPRIPPLNVPKIQHSPLPVTPLRPSLRKNKSVTFDESIDEVDALNRRRTRSMPNALDISEPLKQPSMMDLTAQSVKITPHDIATYTVSRRPPPFNTFPRKKVSKKPSLERIYDEIPSLFHVTAELKAKNSTTTTNNAESTKMTDENTKM